MKVAQKEACTYIDFHSKLSPQCEQITTDGIHLTTAGYQLLAQQINQQL